MLHRIRTKEEFVRRKEDFFSPSKAISDARKLQGRTRDLERLERALSSPGRQAFIFGERGVGKTSLAKTGALQFGSRNAAPVLVGCEEVSSFASVIRAIVQKALQGNSARHDSTTWRAKVGVKTGLFNVEFEKAITSGTIPEVQDVNDAILLLDYVSRTRNTSSVVIVDEFDRLDNDVQKRRFAEFMKQISDQDLALKFIFCGISRDVESLIGSHFSSGRYISPIELGKLNHTDLWAIITEACETFGVEIDREYLIRCSQIADGYPYFMHLLGDCLFWSLFNDQEEVGAVSIRHFEAALADAVTEAEPMLKDAYDKAVKKYDPVYEEVLWAASAHPHFERKWQDIFATYFELYRRGENQKVVGKDTFYQRLLSLTRPEHGEILRTNKNGWYSFSENVVRSYVRLRATAGGVDLAPDMHRVPDSANI
jgi:hypothetical protein